MDEFNREAILVYLKNCRDLEVSKWKLSQLLAQGSQNLAKREKELSLYYQEKVVPEVDVEKELKEASNDQFNAFMCFGGAIITLIAGFFIARLGKSDSLLGSLLGLAFFSIPVGCGAIALALYLVGQGFEQIEFTNSKKEIKARAERVKAQNAKTEAYNLAERNRYNANMQTLNRIRMDWNGQKNYLMTEQSKCNRLLQQAYAMNIIPNKYRNLAAMYYIYDYMSSSRESLTSALFSRQIDEGIQQILSRLNIILQQNERIIIQQRRNEMQLYNISQNISAIKSKNVEILESCQRNEINTQKAADYGRMAANYAEANAYIGLANYLINS